MTKQVTGSESQLLFRALGANGAFSLLCGLAMTSASGPIAELTGVPNHLWVLSLGIGLIFFGASLLVHFRRQRVARAEAVLISGMDLGWVIGSAALLLFAPGLLTPAGFTTVLLVALAVFVFFNLQAYALWQSFQKPSAA